MKIIERNSKKLSEADTKSIFKDKEVIAEIVVKDFLQDQKENCRDTSKILTPPTQNNMNAAVAVVNLFPIYKEMFRPTPVDSWLSQKGGSTGIIQNRLNVVRRQFKSTENAENS